MAAAAAGLFLAEAANGLSLFQDLGEDAEPQALRFSRNTSPALPDSTWFSPNPSFDVFRRRVRMVAFMPFHSLQQAMKYQELLSGSDSDKDTFQALLSFVQRETLSKCRSSKQVMTFNRVLHRWDDQTFVDPGASGDVLRGVYLHLDAFFAHWRGSQQRDDYHIPHMAAKPWKDDNQFDRLPDEVLLHLLSFLPGEAALGRLELVSKRWQNVVGEAQLSRQSFNPDASRRALAFAIARKKVRYVEETNENGLIRMGMLLNEQMKALNALAQPLRAWYLEHFPELQDLLPSEWMTSSSTKAVDWANLVLLLGKRKDIVTAWRGGVANALSSLLGSRKLANYVLATSVISFGRTISEAEEKSMRIHASRIVAMSQDVAELQGELDKMVQMSMPALGSLLSSLTIAKLLEAAGSLVRLAKCTRLNMALLSPHTNLAGLSEDLWDIPRLNDDSYLWQHVVERNPSWEKELSPWQLKRVTNHLARIVGNAARIDAFRDPWSQSACQAYTAQLQQRAQALLSGDRLPTPFNPDVPGLEDENHSDTDDELCFFSTQDEEDSSDSEESEDDSDRGFGSFAGRPEPYVPFGWTSVPPELSSFAAPPQSASSFGGPGPAIATGTGTASVVTAWLVIRTLTSAGLIDEHAMRTLQSLLQADGEPRQQILRCIDEFNDLIDPEHVAKRLCDLASSEN